MMQTISLQKFNIFPQIFVTMHRTAVVKIFVTKIFKSEKFMGFNLMTS